MSHFGDRMLDFLLDRDAGEAPAGALFLEAMGAMPDEAREVRRFFECWVWVRWCGVELPAADGNE